MKGRTGKPTVVLLQEEIRGKSLYEEAKEGDGDDVNRCHDVVERFRHIWMHEVVRDPAWNAIPEALRKNLALEDIDLDQIIHASTGGYVLIDF